MLSLTIFHYWIYSLVALPNMHCRVLNPVLYYVSQIFIAQQCGWNFPNFFSIVDRRLINSCVSICWSFWSWLIIEYAHKEKKIEARMDIFLWYKDSKKETMIMKRFYKPYIHSWLILGLKLFGASRIESRNILINFMNNS